MSNAKTDATTFTGISSVLWRPLSTPRHTRTHTLRYMQTRTLTLNEFLITLLASARVMTTTATRRALGARELTSAHVRGRPAGPSRTKTKQQQQQHHVCVSVCICWLFLFVYATPGAHVSTDLTNVCSTPRAAFGQHIENVAFVVALLWCGWFWRLGWKLPPTAASSCCDFINTAKKRLSAIADALISDQAIMRHTGVAMELCHPILTGWPYLTIYICMYLCYA